MEVVKDSDVELECEVNSLEGSVLGKVLNAELDASPALHCDLLSSHFISL